MIEDLTSIPPAVPLLLVEVLAKGTDWIDARRRLKSLLPELRAQSEFYEAESLEASRKTGAPGKFEIYLDGGLNLFEREAGCRALSCRIASAERLVRSMGLLADTIWLTDYLTERFCRFGRVTNLKLDAILEDTLVLEVLSPLILAGIVKFRTPWVPMCSGCLQHFDNQVDEITDRLATEYSDQFLLESLLNLDAYAMHTGDLYEPPMTMRILPGKKRLHWPPTTDEFSKHMVRTAVNSALWVGREAVLGGGAVFSNSKIGLAGLAYVEGRVRNRSELRLLDEHRTLNLPWVSELKPNQIIQLRQEASKALPMFRETLSRRLGVTDDAGASPSAKDAIDELRLQALDVRNELAVTQQHAKRLWNTPYTMLGLAVSAYGIAADQPATAALGGLMSLLQLVMTHNAGAEKEMDKLQRNPGYVLVKAQDILAHKH